MKDLYFYKKTGTAIKNKPKEFWLYTTSIGEDLIFNERRPNSPNKPSELHLIDYRAYAALKDALAFYGKHTNPNCFWNENTDEWVCTCGLAKLLR